MKFPNAVSISISNSKLFHLNSLIWSLSLQFKRYSQRQSHFLLQFLHEEEHDVAPPPLGSPSRPKLRFWTATPLSLTLVWRGDVLLDAHPCVFLAWTTQFPFFYCCLVENDTPLLPFAVGIRGSVRAFRCILYILREYWDSLFLASDAGPLSFLACTTQFPLVF